MNKKPTATPPKLGRPPLRLSDDERAERLAAQRAAANVRLRERVVYVSVPFSPEIAEWIDAMRAKERPIPGRGPYIAAIVKGRYNETRAKSTKDAK